MMLATMAQLTPRRTVMSMEVSLVGSPAWRMRNR